MCKYTQTLDFGLADDYWFNIPTLVLVSSITRLALCGSQKAHEVT